MLKCKCCKTSDLGVTLIELKKTAVKMVDGEAVGILADPIIEQSYEVNYCFTCSKEITQDDLYENETCPVCGVEVPELINGVCPSCDEEKNKLLNMSKEELILMLMQQAKGGHTHKEVKEEVKPVKEKKEKKKEEPKEITEDKVAEATEAVESQANQTVVPDSLAKGTNADAIDEIGDRGTDISGMPSSLQDADDILGQLDAISMEELSFGESVNAPF